MVYPFARFIKAILLFLVRAVQPRPRPRLQPAPAAGAANPPAQNPQGGAGQNLFAGIHTRDHTFEFSNRFWIFVILVTFLGGIGVLFNIAMVWWMPLPYHVKDLFDHAGWFSFGITFLIVSSLPAISPWYLSVLYRGISFILINYIVGFILAFTLIAYISARL